MTIVFNGAEITPAANVQCNGKAVKQIHYNGNLIWEKQADPVLTPGASVMGGIVDADGMGIVWDVPGTYTFVPPAGVTLVSAVAVGAGGASIKGTGISEIGGGGGALCWVNSIQVTSAGISVTVGAGGVAGGGALANGGMSSVGSVATAGGGASGATGAGGVMVGGNGGNGGRSTDTNRSGGGAGGYAGNGGNGGNSASTASQTIGAGGGGGGGGGGSISTGGGVGLYAQGASGSQGRPGSNGIGQKYGGGGHKTIGGGGGAVRIMWTKPGVTRSFPFAAALVV